MHRNALSQSILQFTKDGETGLKCTGAHDIKGDCSTWGMLDQALRHMGEEDLRYHKRMVVKRLNLLTQDRSTSTTCGVCTRQPCVLQLQ